MLSALVVLFLYGALWPRLVEGHGRIIEPPGRNTLWRFGYKAPPNYEDTQNFCGGIKVQYEDNNGKCGICGDPYNEKLPRNHETGGKYATNITVRSYRPGQEVDIYIDIVANHMGWFQFSLCERNTFEIPEEEDCFHDLPLVDGGGKRYIIPSNKTGIFFTKVRLPEKVTCSACVLRWHWMSGNNWGVCQDGNEKVGCGPQEVYRNCADVSIQAGAGIRGPYYGDFNDLDLLKK